MKLFKWVFLLMFTNTNVFAEDVKILGTIDHIVTVSEQSILKKTEPTVKQIKLLKLELSDTLQKNIKYNLDHQPTLSRLGFTNENMTRVQLGMDNVPVFDQGAHGTCATFAVTAAMDVILNKGDYISQLCLLQLGSFLKQNAYVPSGWQGSSTFIILQRLKMFGIVNKVQQRTNGCGGLTEYPSKNPTTPSIEMPLRDYHLISTPIEQTVDWSLIRDDYTRMDNSNSFKIIDEVKAALNAKNRITFDVVLVDIKKGNVGAVGTFHVGNDSWLLTSEIKKDIQDYTKGNNPDFEYGGHTMIVTGYDDDAVAIDNHGQAHKGLFTLRNSWGESAGDQGDFYMAYDYFAVLTTHAQRIRKPATI